MRPRVCVKGSRASLGFIGNAFATLTCVGVRAIWRTVARACVRACHVCMRACMPVGKDFVKMVDIGIFIIGRVPVRMHNVHCTFACMCARPRERVRE